MNAELIRQAKFAASKPHEKISVTFFRFRTLL